MKVSLDNRQQGFSNLETIEYKSLSDITTDMIRKEIIVGKLLLGSRITEKNLSDRLGVSRMVIREAIINLTKEGLFIKEKNKYTKVVEFSKKDISDIYDLRIALEVAAATKYLELGLDGVELLKAKSEAIDRLSDENKMNSIEKLTRNDIKFHELIIQNSTNKKLISVWKSLSSQVLVLLYKYVINIKEKSKGVRLSYDHNEIIDAFLKKDKHYIQEVITKHITDTKQFLLDNY